MGSIFNMDNGLMSALSKIFDIFLISIIWFICCIPVVTAGAATTALYYAVVKVIRRERGYLIKEYFRSFKLNFKNATFVWIIILVLSMLFYFNIYFVKETMDGTVGFVLMCVYRTFLFVILSVTVFLFPNLSRFAMDKIQLIKVSFLMSIKHLPITILVDLIIIVAALVIWFIPLSFAFIPGLTCLLSSLLLEKVLKKYIPASEDSEKDQWYLE